MLFFTSSGTNWASNHLGKGLYEQVVNLRQKDLKLIAANKNINEAKFKFQGQYARSQRWFDIEFYWIWVNFSRRKPDFHKNYFQSHDNTQDTNKFKIFPVSFTIMPQCSSIVRSRWIAVVLLV